MKNHIYIQKRLKTNSEFYKEALSAISVLNTNKAVRNVDQWDTEHLFYNKHILLEGEENKTLIPTKHFEKNNIYLLGQLFDEKAKEVRKKPSVYTIICFSIRAPKRKTY